MAVVAGAGTTCWICFSYSSQSPSQTKLTPTTLQTKIMPHLECPISKPILCNNGLWSKLRFFKLTGAWPLIKSRCVVGPSISPWLHCICCMAQGSSGSGVQAAWHSSRIGATQCLDIRHARLWIHRPVPSYLLTLKIGAGHGSIVIHTPRGSPLLGLVELSTNLCTFVKILKAAPWVWSLTTSIPISSLLTVFSLNFFK